MRTAGQKYAKLTQPGVPTSELISDSSALFEPDLLASFSPDPLIAAPQFRMIHIDPTAGWGGDGSLSKPYNSWYAFTLQAGDIALQRGGTVALGFNITAHGTASQPIVIGSYGTGKAQIIGTVALDGASNVTMSGLDITGGNSVGVVLTGGTKDCVVQGCDIHGGIAGVLITAGTSEANAISNNQIYENDTAGVWFNEASATAGSETLVAGNTIYRNGQQGILLHGSYIIVDSNTIVNNGLSALPGASALHVIGTSATDTSGRHNVITNNIVADQRDGSSFDGNGILLDTWANDNAVVGNQVFGNDGAGISLFSAGNNLVANNTLQGNVVDSGGTHVISKAEIYLGNATYAPGQTSGNTIVGNTILGNSPYAAAVQVGAEVTADLSNVVTGNKLGQTGTGPVWIWGTQSGGSTAGWNGLTRSGTDTTLTTAPAPPPAFSASLLDHTFTLHSTTFLVPNQTGMSTLVANGPNTEIIGGPQGNIIAGDGQDDVLLAGGGDNLVAAGSGNTIILGQSGSDIFFGGSGNNLMFAGTGDTFMVGGSGNSHMVGGAGNDTIFAGNRSGTDILDGGGGTNSLVGGTGHDTFVLGSGVDYITQFTLAQDKLDVSGLGVTSLTGLQIAGDAVGALIADSAGTIHGVLAGVDGQALSASDFVFWKPV